MEYSTLNEQIQLAIEAQLELKLYRMVDFASSSPIFKAELSSGFEAEWLNLIKVGLGLEELKVVPTESRLVQQGCKATDQRSSDDKAGHTANTTLNPNRKLSYVLPSLVVYSCAAVGGDAKKALDAAVAWEFLLRASYLLDDVQDRDKPHSLVARAGEGKALNIALILLELGQQLEAETLKMVLIDPLDGQPFEDDIAKLRHRFYFKLLEKLFQTIAVASRGQLLDLQEKSVCPGLILNDPNYHLNKAAVKSAVIVSHITELGATLGLGQNLSRSHKQASFKPDAGSALLTWEETIENYRQFGFSFGMALHIINDLKDFVVGLNDTPAKSRDLSHRNPTLPFAYAYQSFDNVEMQQRFLKLWEHNSSFKLEQTDLASSGGDDINIKNCDVALVELIKCSGIDATIYAQTLSTALLYMLQAQTHLKKIDPDLERVEHVLMLNILEDLLRPFKPTVSV
jgi:geranylgeranyl pyrophosphate synthase